MRAGNGKQLIILEWPNEQNLEIVERMRAGNGKQLIILEWPYLEEEDNAAAASVSSILALKLFSRCLPVISRH